MNDQGKQLIQLGVWWVVVKEITKFVLDDMEGMKIQPSESEQCLITS